MFRTVAVAALFAVPALALSACSPNEPVATQPGTTPPVWTGSPAPSPSAGEGQNEGHAASGEKLTAQLKNAGGTTVATADFEFSAGFVTITVKTDRFGSADTGLPRSAHSLGRQV